MNQLKKPSAPAAEEKKLNSKTGAAGSAIHSIVDGTWLEKVAKPENIPFAMFILLLAGLYIANSFSAERTLRQTTAIEKELKELHSEYISMKAELMFYSNQSQVAERVAAIDLIEAKTPPHKIFISKTPQQN
jgi:hypothetical protein